MGKGTTVDGMDAWERKFAALQPATAQALQTSVKKAAKTMAAAIEKTAPVLTGNLKHTLVVKDDTPLQSSVSIGDKETPAAPIEFGHMDGSTHVPAVPFFFPAVRKTGPKARKQIRKDFQDAVLRQWAGGVTGGGEEE